jgi:hypothetical protein
VSISYSVAKKGHEVHDLVAAQIEAHHPDLLKHKVTVGVDFAGVPLGESLKCKGVPCHAYVKITPLRQRIRGYPDAVITIDARHWADEAGEEQRAALIDHELAHLLVCFDKDKFVKSDDIGRPKLRIRPHDIEVGWFLDVAERHGEASYEVAQARRIADDHGQLLFGWAAEGVVPMNRRKAV